MRTQDQEIVDGNDKKRTIFACGLKSNLEEQTPGEHFKTLYEEQSGQQFGGDPIPKHSRNNPDELPELEI